jgi:hypothetical protein
MTRSSSVLYLVAHIAIFALGVYLTRRPHHSATQAAVGAGLIAAGVAGWALFLHVFLQQEERGRLRRIDDIGVADVFSERSVGIRSEYNARLNAVARNIDILGFGLQHLRQDYRDQFPAWAGAAQVRILLIDPDSPYANTRDVEEGEAPGSIAQQVRDFLTVTTALRQQNPSRFQVRLYTALPSINMFRIDDEMFFGPYLLSRPSRLTPTFLLRRGKLFNDLLDHFEHLWSDDFSKPAP